MSDYDFFREQPMDLSQFLGDPDNFLIGMELEKSRDASDGHWRVQGIASCELPDSDAEEVIQKGIDTEPLMEWGQINWDHQDTRRGPEYLIGVPLETAIVSASDFAEQLQKSINGPALYVKGELYQDNKIARGVWQYLEAQRRGLRPRKLGWSVQGRVVQRDPLRRKRVLRSACHHLALSHQPVLKYTFADLVKSYAADGVLSTVSGQPLLKEQLGRTLTTLLTGDCEHGCLEKSQSGRARFRDGVRGAMTHLCECHGMPVDDAHQCMRTLIQGGYKF